MWLVPWPVAIALGVGMGAVLGGINGFVIARTGIDSFVVTLGTGSVFTGIMYILTKVEAFRNLPTDFVALGQDRFLGVSVLVWVMTLAAAGLFVLYRGTTLGRQMLATGANPRAARLSGISVNRVVEVTHMLSGALAGLAGIMLVLLKSARPSRRSARTGYSRRSRLRPSVARSSAAAWCSSSGRSSAACSSRRSATA